MDIPNYLITESEVLTGKSQTEAASPYWPSDSKVNTVGRGFPVTTERLRLLSSLLYGTKTKIKQKSQS